MFNEQQKYQQQIQDIIEKNTSKIDATQLGLSLSLAVYTYEILNDKVGAFKIAKKAFDGALSELDQLSQENYKDVTILMQLLRDNLILWESEQQNEINKKAKEQD